MTDGMSFDVLAQHVLDGGEVAPKDALAVLRAGDDELVPLVAAAGRLRRRFFGNTVKVNYLVNLKSGLCPEDCGYCSQALGAGSDILRYTWLKTDEALEQATAGLRGGARAAHARQVGLEGRGRSGPDPDFSSTGSRFSWWFFANAQVPGERLAPSSTPS